MISDTIEDIYELSPMQKGILFNSIYKDNSSEYIIQADILLKGDLDSERFEQACAKVIENHAILRTSFHWEEIQQPLQVVHNKVTPVYNTYDCRHLSDSQIERKITRFLENNRKNGFKLTDKSQFHINLFQQKTNYRLILSFHHIIMDGWSFSKVLSEIFQIYEASGDYDSTLNPTLPPYSDFIKWIKKQDVSDAERFWSQQLKGFNSPTKIVNAEKKSFETIKIDFKKDYFDFEDTKKITAYCKQNKVTLNTLFQGVWAHILSVYSGEEDVLFGGVVSGRPVDLLESDKMVGLFINTLPVRVKMARSMKVTDWLKSLQLEQVKSREYDFCSLVDIYSYSQLPAGTQMFDTILAFENYPNGSKGKSKSSIEIQNIKFFEKGEFPISVAVSPSSDSITVKLSYDSNLFNDYKITNLLNLIKMTISEIVNDETKLFKQLPVLASEEKQLIVNEWNDTAKTYPDQPSLSGWFEEQVAETPDATAFIYEGEALTYQELNERANRLAHYLQKQGVGQETLVGLSVERSTDMMVGLLAILKAGGAYVPLDPSYPKERLAYMIEDTHIQLLLTQSRIRHQLPDHQATLVCMDNIDLQEEPVTNPASQISPNHMAYVMYTSGSTGKPKGVMVPHAGVLNRLMWMKETHPLQAGDKTLQKTPFSFDVSVWEFFWPLVSGATLVMARPNGHLDSQNLIDLIEQEQITMCHFVPSMLNLLLEEDDVRGFSSIKKVFCSGEELPHTLQEAFFMKFDAELINLYGPTEASIEVASWACRSEERPPVPIGKPIANTQLYILDPYLQPVPVGVKGELYIGGQPVTRGYWKRPDLTAERFIPNPFVKEGRLYRTGDVASFRQDGNIDYHGRIDNQVKIRGTRIELGEIEAALQSHEKVKDAVVVVHQKGEEKELIGYIIEDEAVTYQEIYQYLSEKVPVHMIVAQIVKLSQFPLTSSGKVDRNALPEPMEEGEAQEEIPYQKPETETEQILCGIWEDVLGVDRVGVHDNFFQLGGHSLLAIRVISRLRKRYSPSLPLNIIYKTHTLKELAKTIDDKYSNDNGTDWEIKKIARSGNMPLSFAQYKFWILNELSSSAALNTVPVILKIREDVNENSLRNALEHVVDSQETLKTLFVSCDGFPAQRILESMDVNLEVIDLSSISDDEKNFKAERLIDEQMSQGFNLEKGLLFRSVLIKMNKTEYIFVNVFHHIIFDGESSEIFIKEVLGVYHELQSKASIQKTPLRIQYVDYANWQRNIHERGDFADQLSYWKETLKNPNPKKLTLFGKTLKGEDFYQGKILSNPINEDTLNRLKEVCRNNEATLYQVLLSSFKSLLYFHSKETDIAVGSPVSNREHEDLENIIGCFINTVVLRTKMDENNRFVELLDQIKKTTKEAFAKQNVPFEEVLKEIQSQKQVATSDLFQVWFVLHRTNQELGTMKGMKVETYKLDHRPAKFSLHFDVFESDNSLETLITYDPNIFTQKQIQNLNDQYGLIIKAIVENPDIHVKDLLARIEDFNKKQWLKKRPMFKKR